MPTPSFKRKSPSDTGNAGGDKNDDDDDDRRSNLRKTVSNKRSKISDTSKVSQRASQTSKIDSDGNPYWEISKMRRVTISEFRGKNLVNIREYYEKDGKQLPGKKV